MRPPLPRPAQTRTQSLCRSRPWRRAARGGRPQRRAFVCALAENPRNFPAAPLAALRCHRRASCAAPGRNSLCLFPPDGQAGGGGGAGGQEGSAGPAARRRGQGALRSAEPERRGTTAGAPPAAGHPGPPGTPPCPLLLRCHSIPPPLSEAAAALRPPGGWPRRSNVVRSAAAMCVLPESAGERPTTPEARAEVAVDLLADLRATWPPQPGGRPGLFITGGRTQSLSPSPSASRGYFVPAVQTIFNLYPLP